MSSRLRTIASFAFAEKTRAACPAEDRSILFASCFALFSLVVSPPFLPVYILAGITSAWVAITLLSIMSAVTVVLNATGWHVAARHVFLISANVTVFTTLREVGAVSGLHTIYFVTLVLALLFFDLKRWRHLVFAVAFPMLGICLSVAPNVSFMPHPPSHLDVGIAVAPYVYAISVCVVLAEGLAFVGISARYERSARAAEARLNREIRMVQLLQDVAIIANSAGRLDQAMASASARIGALTGWRAVQGLEPALEREATLDAAPRWRIVRASGEARAAGVNTTHHLIVAVPVICREHIAAVMLFTGDQTEAPSPELLDTLANVGKQLGNVEERRLAAAQVAESHMKMVAAAKMATLGEMAGGIAHEINNPLAVIQGYLARIRRYAGFPETKGQTDEAIDSIHATIQRITRIVNGLRAFARDSAKDPLEPTSVGKIVSDTLALSSERFRKNGIALEVGTLTPDLPLECRSSQVSQVLLNLLNNAYDAVRGAKERVVRLDVAAEHGMVVFVVSDTGHGIPKDIQDKVLQPFFTTKTIGRGTGLGLSISKGIIESHGGSLEFTSEAGRTRFVVKLPERQNEEARGGV